MNIRLHRPAPPLAADVALLWHLCSTGTPHAFERSLPDGTMALIINLREDTLRLHDRRDPARTERRHAAIVAGPRAEFDVIASHGPQEIMGVCFTPGGCAAFLPMPASEIATQDVDLAQLWGDRAHELWARLRACDSVAGRLQLLETALLRERLPRPRRHPAVRLALDALGAADAVTVAEVVERTGLSARRLIDLFQAEVGLTPKVFQRVRRFQRVVGRLYGDREPDLPDVALDCGYCDQAHFIHDFRAFAGTTPTAYLARRTHHRNHAVFE